MSVRFSAAHSSVPKSKKLHSHFGLPTLQSVGSSSTGSLAVAQLVALPVSQSVQNLVHWPADEDSMRFGDEPTSTAMNQLREAEIRVHGELIPVATSYNYLGLPFNFRLHLEPVIRSRVEAGKRALSGMRNIYWIQPYPSLHPCDCRQILLNSGSDVR
jgi:hypothetical protein